jgi:molybdenum cofactor biosynthesis enzyme MoaA
MLATSVCFDSGRTDARVSAEHIILMRSGASMVDCPAMSAEPKQALPASAKVRILHDREHISRKLRISLTDACNLRCFFCHNEGQGDFARVRSPLGVPDYRRIVQAAIGAGTSEIKLTGGEPLLYSNSGGTVIDLVTELRKIHAFQHFGLSMTTNGLLLERYASALKKAGLDRVTISLHTLDQARHRALLGYGNAGHGPAEIVNAIQVAISEGLTPVKVNTVLFGHGDDSNIAELPDIVQMCRAFGVTQLRLYTLLGHEQFTNHADWYRFWDSGLLDQISRILFADSADAAAFVDAATSMLQVRENALYPKPALVVTSGSLEVTIEDLQVGRFDAYGLPDEGPYALRLSASGELRGVLSRSAPALDIRNLLRQTDGDAALEEAFRVARRDLVP